MVNKRKFTPEGVEDINAIQYEKKEWIQLKIKEVFKRFGYKQILTPTFEYYDLFSEIDSAIDTEDMYKLIDASGKILVLRPDVTIPIARMAATKYKSINENLKFMYFTSVFRSSDFRAGGKREFVQAGVEYLGNSNPEADAEVIVTAINSLTHMGFENIHIDIGQTDYFKGIMNEIEIAPEIKNSIRQLIENKNFADLGILLDSLDIESTYKDLLMEVPYLYGDFEEIAQRANQRAMNDTMKKSAKNLLEIHKIIDAYGYKKYVFADLGLINHLDYYSGMIFKGYVGNFGTPILSGGRYDDLFKKFGKEVPAIGFGMNVDAMLEAAHQYEFIKEVEEEKDYLLLYDDLHCQVALRKSMELRASGYVVETERVNSREVVDDDFHDGAGYKKIMAVFGNEITEVKKK